jgi:hypothetical protein
MNPTVSEEQDPTFQALPTPQSCRVINFEAAQVIILQSQPPHYVLVVKGQKSYFNMTVSLMPLVYIRQPEFWGIEVTGCLPELGVPAVTPYVVSLRLDGIIGTRGIEVIGADRSEKIDISGFPTAA